MMAVQERRPRNRNRSNSTLQSDLSSSEAARHRYRTWNGAYDRRTSPGSPARMRSRFRISVPRLQRTHRRGCPASDPIQTVASPPRWMPEYQHPAQLQARFSVGRCSWCETASRIPIQRILTLPPVILIASPELLNLMPEPILFPDFAPMATCPFFFEAKTPQSPAMNPTRSELTSNSGWPIFSPSFFPIEMWLPLIWIAKSPTLI